MTEDTESKSLKRKIPPDLQREVEEIQNKKPRIIGIKQTFELSPSLL